MASYAMLPATQEGHLRGVPKPQGSYVVKPAASMLLKVAGLIAGMVLLSLRYLLSGYYKAWEAKQDLLVRFILFAVQRY